MAWFFLRRGVDLLVALVLYKHFDVCASPADVILVLDRSNDLEQIGAIAAGVLLVVSAAEVLQPVVTAVRSYFSKRPPTKKP